MLGGATAVVMMNSFMVFGFRFIVLEVGKIPGKEDVLMEFVSRIAEKKILYLKQLNSCLG